MNVTDVAPGERELARSLLYQVLATLLRYPSSETCAEPLLGDDAVAAVVALLDDGPHLGALLEEVRERLAAAPLGDLESSYVDLFGHSVRGTCPLYESEFGEARGSTQLPHGLSDLGAFYRAFGLRPSRHGHERVDHIATECEFMHFLMLKQSYAAEHDLEDLAAATTQARTTFLRDHLGRWAPAFFRRVVQADEAHGGGVYATIARFGLAVVHADCAEIGVRSGSEKLRLVVRSDTPDDVFDCGVPTDCPGAGSPASAQDRGGAPGGGCAPGD